MKKIFKDNLMVPNVKFKILIVYLVIENAYTRSQLIIPKIISYGKINA